MPPFITNDANPQSASYTPMRDLKYKYPNNIDLRPGSTKHQRILSKLLTYARESAMVINKRRPAWEQIDDKLQAFIPQDKKERKITQVDPRRPTSIVFPYSYAILETLVSYLMAAFGTEPIFRYEGSGPEDIPGAMLMEKVINHNIQRNKVLLNLHTMFRDASAYGLGIVSPQWETRYGVKVTRNPVGYYGDNGTLIPDGIEVIESEEVIYEGNSLVNIDPYFYLPDPNVSIHDVQKGEFAGWMDRDSYINLLTEEAQSNGTMFNVKYLRSFQNRSTSIFSSESLTSTRRRNFSARSTQLISTSSIDLLTMYVKLIPKDWGLGTSTRPEKWLFLVGGDSVILKANKLNLYHNMFPICITAPDFDGYSPVSYSRLEILNGMQVTIDFLFNSHIANVRKAINDMLVVDPYLVNVKDLEDPEPGKIIRLRRPAWGKGVSNAVQQLNVQDITQQNLQNVAYIIQYMQQVGGTDNPMMGNLRRGGPERLSAREVDRTSQGAFSRMDRIGKIVGLQAMQDVGYMFASHSQQLMEEDVYLRTIGEWPEQISREFNINQGRVLVTPRDIQVDYDLIVRDGSVPGGNFSNVWVELFKTISSNPALLQTFDIVRIFEFIATNSGAKNVEMFRQQPTPTAKVLPDEQIDQDVERGNLIPMLDALGA